MRQEGLEQEKTVLQEGRILLAPQRGEQGLLPLLVSLGKKAWIHSPASSRQTTSGPCVLTVAPRMPPEPVLASVGQVLQHWWLWFPYSP